MYIKLYENFLKHYIKNFYKQKKLRSVEDKKLNTLYLRIIIIITLSTIIIIIVVIIIFFHHT